MHELHPGDACWRPGAKRHVGIYVGRSPWSQDPIMVHNMPGRGVVLDTLAEFSAGHEVGVYRVPLDSERAAIVQRSMAARGRSYDVMTYNCEHFVHEVFEGRRRSPQLRQTLVWSGILVGAVGLVASSNGTWTDEGGYRRDADGRFA
jgi:hypothetical protein